MKIAIIGMGCSGSLVLRGLSEKLPHNSQVELLLFEPATSLGPGLPYGSQFNDDRFILNMQSTLLGTNQEDLSEFSAWLKQNGLDNLNSAYTKRRHMGVYLEDVVKASLTLLRKKKIRYNIVQNALIDIKKEANNYQLLTQKTSYEANQVVLAIGHLPKVSPFPNSPKYIANPYHALETIKKIEPSAHVGILGTKLTAVDIALLLNKQGIKKISMFSKSGRLPLVREESLNTQYPIPPIPQDRTLLSLLKIIKQKYKNLNTHQWQALLDETKEFIDDYWVSLSAFQKKLFLSKYKGLWMSIRHPMPLENASAINDIIAKKELYIHAGYCSIASLNNHFQVKFTNYSFETDYVIDATGTPPELSRIDSPLIRNLLHSGWMKQYEFGGVEINRSTFELQNMKGIFVIGQLTLGTIFYVSAIERLLKHADAITTSLLAALSPRYSFVDSRENLPVALSLGEVN